MRASTHRTAPRHSAASVHTHTHVHVGWNVRRGVAGDKKHLELWVKQRCRTSEFLRGPRMGGCRGGPHSRRDFKSNRRHFRRFGSGGICAPRRHWADRRESGFPPVFGRACPEPGGRNYRSVSARRVGSIKHDSKPCTIHERRLRPEQRRVPNLDSLRVVRLGFSTRAWFEGSLRSLDGNVAQEPHLSLRLQITQHSNDLR